MWEICHGRVKTAFTAQALDVTPSPNVLNGDDVMGVSRSVHYNG